MLAAAQRDAWYSHTVPQGTPSASEAPHSPSLQQTPATVATADDEASRGAESSGDKGMAFLSIDPEPMLLAGFERVLLEGRPKYSRVVTSRTMPAKEDLAIVTVSNFPPGEVPFAFVRNAVLALLEGEYQLCVAEVQCCPLGGARPLSGLEESLIGTPWCIIALITSRVYSWILLITIEGPMLGECFLTGNVG